MLQQWGWRQCHVPHEDLLAVPREGRPAILPAGLHICASSDCSIEWPHRDDIEHAGVHVETEVAVKCPVAGFIRSQIEADLAAGQHIDRVLAWVITRMPIHDFKEMTMQVNRMLHHRVIDQRHPDALIAGEADWLDDGAELAAIERPHEALHVAGQMYFQ